MSEQLQKLRVMVGALLAKSLPTPEMIREQIELVRKALPAVSDEEAEDLALEFEHIHGVTMDFGSTLEDPGFEKWLDEAKGETDFYYWGRYRRLLAEGGFSGQVLATLDSVTDRTLGLLGNPKKEGKWDRRGMVVGHVQSGKTANYIGLVSKAADAGYKVIIIIAGIHNNLRSQTQSRLDEGFIGYSSKLLIRRQGVGSIIGVGRHDSSRRPSAFTNTLKDFNKQTANSIRLPLVNLNEPAVFVIKKNTNTLRNLLDWLKEHNAIRGDSSIREPMLLVDDEADNASINIRKGQDEVSRINGQLRQLLDVFDRSCYIGYTATPFANIFIDPDSDDEMFGEDLFPRDFIVSLDPPDNYFGASRVFLTDPEDEEGLSPIVRHIEDSGDLLPLKHRKDHVVTGLPESLKDAVRAFIVGRTIRLIRGHEGSHNSMLVNVSRFTDVQRKIRNEIHNLLDTIRGSVRVNGAQPTRAANRDPEIAALKRIFDIEYDHAEVTWTNVQSRLWDSISPIRVIEVNSRSSDSLDYDDHKKSGLNVIAVGGFSLSRGLTLEGLLISYFLRNSMMYDTLMQMGRWFGYRPGFDDLCRVWMPEEAEGWYAHIAVSIEELRDELRRMEAVNATPRDFGLKVRSHPDTLIVTARNKMGSGKSHVVQIGLANQFVETAILKPDEESTDTNRRAAISLAESLRSIGIMPEEGGELSGGRLFRSVPVSHVTDFLSVFLNHPASIITETDPVRKYIEERAGSEMSVWDVFFPGLQSEKENSLVDSSLGFKVICQRRGKGGRSDTRILYITEKQRVSSRGIEKIGLPEDEIERANLEYRNQADPDNTGKILNYPDRIYRRVRKRPLLVIHLLAIGKKEDDLSKSKPIIAWSISFPRTRHEERKVEYIVNTTWFRERFQEEGDEEEAEGDHE